MKSIFTLIVICCGLIVRGGGIFSLYEINPLHGNSPLTIFSDSAKTYYGAGALSGFTEMNGKLYFIAQKTPGDDELWCTDGTLDGTNLVKEINSSSGAQIGNLVYVNSHILFMATDNGATWDLWSTDGTDAGTVKIDVLNAPTNSALGPYNVSTMGNRLIFCAQQKLLVTDGTLGGTDSLLSIATYSQGFGYCDLRGIVYFVLPEVEGDDEIWLTDGTSGGTQSLMDLSDSPFKIATAKDMVSVNGNLYLTAVDSSQSMGLYTLNGSANGQLSRVSITPGNAQPQTLKLFNGALYFIASDSNSSNIYQISTDNPVPTPLIPNSTATSLSNLSFANNTVYCTESGKGRIHAIELSSQAYRVLDLPGYYLPTFAYPGSSFLVGVNGQIYFEAYDSSSKTQVLFQSDFTPAGTHVLTPDSANTTHPFNCFTGSGNTDIFDLQIWNNNVVVPANFTDAGRELWILNPDLPAGTVATKAAESIGIFPNPASNSLIVKLELTGDSEKEINITNINGQTVLRQILAAETTTVNLNTFAEGSYLVVLLENGKPTNTKKLVVIK